MAHCDKINFFKWKDLKMWSELLEIFSKKIALEKIKMDKLYENKKEKLEISIPLVPPF